MTEPEARVVEEVARALEPFVNRLGVTAHQAAAVAVAAYRAAQDGGEFDCEAEADRVAALYHGASREELAEGINASLVMLAERTAQDGGAEEGAYPHSSGDVTVIGPECFANADESVICWRGQNFYTAEGKYAADCAALAAQDGGAEEAVRRDLRCCGAGNPETCLPPCFRALAPQAER